jgi:hypothetical protein
MTAPRGERPDLDPTFYTLLKVALGTSDEVAVKDMLSLDIALHHDPRGAFDTKPAPGYGRGFV